MERFQEPPVPAKSFAELIKEFLNSPGYSTSEVTKYGGHDEYMKELSTRNIESKTTMPPTEPKIEAVTPVQSETDRIAEEYTAAFTASDETFMLGEPLTLTVLRDKGYSKAPHVGSEDFKPVRAYMGKRGKMIFVFKPVMVTDYKEMEMDEAQAVKSLLGFQMFLNEHLKSVVERLKETRIELAAEAERKSLADRYEKYEGFGSW